MANLFELDALATPELVSAHNENPLTTLDGLHDPGRLAFPQGEPLVPDSAQRLPSSKLHLVHLDLRLDELDVGVEELKRFALGIASVSRRRIAVELVEDLVQPPDYSCVIRLHGPTVTSRVRLHGAIAPSFQVADGRFEPLVHVPQGFPCDVNHVAVRLVVERLVAPEGLGILHFDQDIPAPSGAVRLVVRYAAVDATPVSCLGERLEALAPCLIECRLGDARAIDEPL